MQIQSLQQQSSYILALIYSTKPTTHAIQSIDHHLYFFLIAKYILQCNVTDKTVIFTTPSMSQYPMIWAAKVKHFVSAYFK